MNQDVPLEFELNQIPREFFPIGFNGPVSLAWRNGGREMKCEADDYAMPNNKPERAADIVKLAARFWIDGEPVTREEFGAQLTL